MTKLAIISDLHYDQWASVGRKPNYLEWKNDENCDAIIIAGDLHNNVKNTTDLVSFFSKQYPLVFFTDGNHEHYGSLIPVSEYTSAILSQPIDSKFYFDGSFYYKIDNTAIVGCNGWYDWNYTKYDDEEKTCKKATNDWRLINFDLTPPELARKHVDLLKHQVKTISQMTDINNIVVFTHTVPHERGLITTPWDFFVSNGAFYNSLMHEVILEDTNKKISHWIYGHTHMANDFVENNIRYICNPWGYTFEPTPSQRFGPVIIEV